MQPWPDRRSARSAASICPTASAGLYGARFSPNIHAICASAKQLKAEHPTNQGLNKDYRIRQLCVHSLARWFFRARISDGLPNGISQIQHPPCNSNPAPPRKQFHLCFKLSLLSSQAKRQPYFRDQPSFGSLIRFRSLISCSASSIFSLSASFSCAVPFEAA